MLKNLLVLLAILSQLNSISNQHQLNLKDFCRLTEKECSQTNAPYTHKCGPSMCTTNQKKCSHFLIVEKTFKYLKLKSMIEMHSMSQFIPRNNSELKLIKDFTGFQSKIKNCAQTNHKWRPTDVCVRGRYCFRKKSNTIGLNNVDCPCPNNKPYVCGSQRNYCSANRHVCGSFSFTNKNTNSTDRFQLLGIKPCGFSFIIP